ncbi:MAG: aspartate kinase [Thermoanaerobacterales bacterium]|nr:aspartate kinase [Bacillota bacterium]MDI6906229.1 aspartate kinase [Thermoanaerobacterales bacterium]
MRFLVLKFGGTSVATPELRSKMAERVLETVKQGFHPVVVVSAIGRLGDPYATDSLLNLVRDIDDQLPGREQDLLLSCGEIISAVLTAATLRRRGLEAFSLTGAQAGIITSGNFTEARILRVEPRSILNAAAEGRIAVVAGFQGISEDGEVTTLGRGGSDTTAAALAVALDAAAIDIYTDVDGVMTADPRIVGEARLLEKVTYNEICQLAQEGAKVIHPRAVEIAMQKNIPLRVKSTFSGAPGTLITSHAEVFPGAIDITTDRLLTGITYIRNITQFSVPVAGRNAAASLFNALGEAGISVDLINVHPDLVAFTVREAMAERAAGILDGLGLRPSVRPDCAKVAAVGAAMTGVPGVMGRIVSTLAAENIPILQSSDSYTTIWVLVPGEDMERAIRALYRAFHLGDG